MTKSKYTYESMRELFESRGYNVLSTEFKKVKDKVKFICPNGHSGEIDIFRFQNGRGCRKCGHSATGNKLRKSIEEVFKIFEDRGYTPLFKEYKNYKEKLSYICLCGNINVAPISSIIKGCKCKNCMKKTTTKYDIKTAINIFKKNGLTLIDKNVKNSTTKMKCVCERGHTLNMTISSMLRGRGCIHCKREQMFNVQRFKYDFVKSEFEKKGIKLISKTYNSSNSPLHVECENGHSYYPTFSNFQKGTGCPKCSNHISKPELEILKLLRDILPNIEIVTNSRKIIAPKELDIYIPNYNLAIEYCGLFWHSDKNLDRSYHYNKMIECDKKNIRLITIFEDEWIYKKDIVVSKIIQAINKTETKIFARKCKILKIDSKTANTFYEKTHTQGKTSGPYHYGLFYNNELVMTISIGKSSRQHTYNGLEIKRISTKLNVTVVGGISKLLTYIIKDLNIEKLRTHNDLRWGKLNSSVYESLGFKKIGESKYTPHYFKGFTRKRNYGLRKTKEEQKLNKTEYELREKQGWSRIWDCGHETYEFNKIKEIEHERIG